MERLEDRFDLHEKVGEGATGTVVRATDRRTGETVAVKILHQAGIERERLAREIAAIRRLQHPAIVKYVCDGETAGGIPFLAMEWVDGDNLAERKDPTRILDRDALEIVAQAADAVGRAHAAGIVHRDIKPGNLLYLADDPPRIKIVDFGLAIFAESALLTRPGALVGTPNYMAPEQVRGSREVDGRADLYALGAVLFELLTGQPPFEGPSAVAILVKVVLEEPPRLHLLRREPISAAIEEVVGRAMRKRPEDRFQSGREMAQALRAAMRGDGTAVRKRRSRVARVVAVLLASGGEGVEEIATDNGAVATTLQGGAVVATFGLGQTRGDEAVRAARTAMRIRAKNPRARLAIASGVAHVSEGTVTGEVVDVAAALLGRARSGEIRLDTESVGVLGERFELLPAGDDRVLGTERAVPAVRRVVGVATPTLGREAELRTLELVYDRVERERTPRAVLVVGAAGIGKSRLLAELLKGVGSRDKPPVVLSCRGDPVRASSFAALTQALRRSTGIQDGDPPATQRALLDARLGAVMTGDDLAHCKVFLGELAGLTETGKNDALVTARANPGLMHRQVRAAMAALLKAESADRPFIIVVEDLQWVGHDTIKTVGWLAQWVEAPLFAIGLTRPEAQQVGWAALGGSRGTLLELGPLSVEQLEELARLTLGDRIGELTTGGGRRRTTSGVGRSRTSQRTLERIDETRLRRVAARAGGNPLFLEEMVRALARGDRGRMPATVQAIVQAELDRLGHDAREAAKLASVFGLVFWDRALGDLADALPELVEDEIVVPRRRSRFADATEYAFRNVPTYEGAYGLIDDSERARLHRHARRWLEKAGEHDATVLAHHAALAGDHGHAAVLYERGAEASLDAGFFAVAVRFASKALEHASEPEIKARLHLIRARAQRRLGGGGTLDHDAALAAATLPRGSVEHAQAVWEISATLRAQGRFAEALREVDSALAATNLPPAGEVMLLAQRSTLQVDAGRIEEAIDLADRACTLAESAGRAHTEEHRRALSARAFALSHHGDLARALSAHEALVREAIESDDPLAVATGRANAGYVLSALGRFKEAITTLEEAERIARSIDARTVRGFIQENLAIPLARVGRLEDGIAKARQAIGIGEHSKEPRLTAAGYLSLATLLLERGNPGDGSEALKSAGRAQAAAEPFPAVRCEAHAIRAQAFLAAGNAGAARTLVATASQLMGDPGCAGVRAELVHLVEVEVALALGRDDDADHALREAYRAVDARLGAIKSPKDREAVRRTVPEVRRILELYDDRLGDSGGPVDTVTEFVR